MTERSPTQPPVAKLTPPRHPGKIVLPLIGGVIAICICTLGLGMLVFRNTPTVEARDAMIGAELGADGHILKDNRTITSNAEQIHLEFYFENPTSSKLPLEFRWYVGDQLLYSYSDVHENGYVSAYIVRDPKILASFPAGSYHVEVWFGNTMILSEPFVVE
jgi:hypothetical protein